MKNTRIKLSFQPRQVVKRLLSSLPVRGRTILESRYGLGKSTEPMTLEAIGKTYKITRERVRQIENYSLGFIRKSEAYTKEKEAFDALERVLTDLGGIVAEAELLKALASNEAVSNAVHFLLVVGEPFKKKKEDMDFRHRWYVDEEFVERIERAIKNLYAGLKDEEIVTETEMIANFLDSVKDISEKYKNEEIAKRWLGLSKRLGRNPLGEWGVSHSPNIRAKGMRDFAYLAIRRHGSPMHFAEVARAIQALFDRKAHVATCHNELIKDPRFVLIGRGLYALKEWGYSPGIVRDVIREILKKEGPLTKDEILERVLKERYVKHNTILVNLQNNSYFRRGKEGKYYLA